MSAFFLLLFFVFILSIISGSLIYYAERLLVRGGWPMEAVDTYGIQETEPSPSTRSLALCGGSCDDHHGGHGDFYPTTILGKCRFFTVRSSVLSWRYR